MTKCALCGFKFDERALACHSQCPLAEGCAIICCPNCGYQVVDETRSGVVALVNKARKMWLRWQPPTATKS